jgi:hypothetical protein
MRLLQNSGYSWTLPRLYNFYQQHNNWLVTLRCWDKKKFKYSHDHGGSTMMPFLDQIQARPQ